MALRRRAELRLSKIELVSAWAPTQPWFVGDATAPLTNMLTTVHQLSEAMGAKMAQIILSLLRGEPMEHQCIMQTHIVERDSA